MNKKIFINFIKDNLFFTGVYFLSNFLVGLFYYIDLRKDVEIIYPASISAGMYLIFISYKLYSYIQFNTRINKLINNINYDIPAYTSEEKEFIKVVTAIHQSYLEKINSIKAQNEHRKHFISQWIHNMKTPVSVIDLVVQKTMRQEIPPQNALEDIGEENAKLLNKLEQILNIMRLEDFTEDYVPQTVDLTAAVKKIINNRKKQFIYSKVYPKFMASEEKIEVLSDEKWNEAMLDQIISNAIKYSNVTDKSKNVSFTIKRGEGKVLLSIKDEGVGIPEYDLARIFNPFFTGDNGRSYSGATGIGLYFCKQIAKKLGNELIINSKVGEGTEVTIVYLAKM